jgi:hypothetical protein
MELKQAALRIIVLAMAVAFHDQFHVEAAVREHHRFGGVSNIQRLHEKLSIDTSDPREDIRTNRLLNMEGF